MQRNEEMAVKEAIEYQTLKERPSRLSKRWSDDVNQDLIQDDCHEELEENSPK